MKLIIQCGDGIGSRLGDIVEVFDEDGEPLARLQWELPISRLVHAAREAIERQPKIDPPTQHELDAMDIKNPTPLQVHQYRERQEEIRLHGFPINPEVP